MHFIFGLGLVFSVSLHAEFKLPELDYQKLQSLYATARAVKYSELSPQEHVFGYCRVSDRTRFPVQLVSVEQPSKERISVTLRASEDEYQGITPHITSLLEDRGMESDAQGDFTFAQLVRNVYTRTRVVWALVGKTEYWMAVTMCPYARGCSDDPAKGPRGAISPNGTPYQYCLFERVSGSGATKPQTANSSSPQMRNKSTKRSGSSFDDL